VFSSLQKHATSNLSYISELELVAPVVDCTFDLLVLPEEEVNRLRMYFLVRQKSNSSETLLLSMLMSTQDFQVPQQYQSGAGLVATIAAIDDMRATEVVHRFAIAYNYPYQEEPHFTSADMLSEEPDNFLLLQSQPDEGSIDPAKTVRTAFRLGTYIDDPVAQSNIEVTHWDLPSDPASELSTWRWHAVAVVHDSWAWTHIIHAIFSLDVLFDLSVLFVVIYQRLQKGHFWIGDAFATISNALLYRGVLVFVSNHVNGYWTLTEFCVAIGSELSGVQTLYYRPELVHADLLTFFLNITSILSYLFRERIDPVLAFAAFELGFAYRVELVDALPGLRKVVVDFADANHALGLVNAGPYLSKLSPMKVWSIHEVTVDRKPVVIATMVGIFSTLTLLVFYILTRKVYRYYRLKTDASARRASRYVADVVANEGLTSFETATGAALSKRYGVICGYDNYVIRESKRFASIDAVYGNGYLSVNSKFLVATEDILSLLLMKVTNVRFTNLYVYALLADGGVNQTAQLVYPNTIPWSDFVLLGVAKLA
jgi:hypothetical protein